MPPMVFLCALILCDPYARRGAMHSRSCRHVLSRRRAKEPCRRVRQPHAFSAPHCSPSHLPM